MSLLLLQSASWTKPKAKSRNWPMIRNPRAATPCDSVAKFGREDLEMRLRPPTRFESAFSLILGLGRGETTMRVVIGVFLFLDFVLVCFAVALFSHG
jgi:hypothetical protein